VQAARDLTGCEAIRRVANEQSKDIETRFLGKRGE
jgi:hypothetical protein